MDILSPINKRLRSHLRRSEVNSMSYGHILRLILENFAVVCSTMIMSLISENCSYYHSCLLPVIAGWCRCWSPVSRGGGVVGRSETRGHGGCFYHWSDRLWGCRHPYWPSGVLLLWSYLRHWWVTEFICSRMLILIHDEIQIEDR